jgi:signal transduction histidine kinase
MANPAFYDKFHRKREDTENRVLFDLGPGEWNPRLRELLQKVLREKHEVTDFEVQYDTPHLGHMIMSVSARQLHEVRGSGPKILLVIRDVTERRDREDKIQQLLARLMTAREDEGKRIARELHDSFGPRLARVNLLVSGVQGQLASQPELSNELERIKTEVSEVAKASHDLSYGLHPSALVHLGIEAALESECVNFSKATGITVTFSAKNVPDSLSDTVALCLYRIAQEALQNIRRHAQAKAVAATLTGIGPDLVMIIRDSGTGFDAQAVRANGGLGLASMEERLRLVNGKVNVSSKLGEGTQVEVRIPLGTALPAIRVRID